ncbi:hypothetical protein U9M48_040415, partial [Paspalum notatum var. saurae]
SNERDHPTLERIDRAFVSAEWLERFPDHWLRALSSDCSDHSPLLLQLCVVTGARRRFQFESIWTKYSGYSDVVAEAWAVDFPELNPCRRLDIKLRCTAKALKGWSSKFVGSVRLQLALAREIVLQFDIAQESRTLSANELALKRQLKLKCLGLASLSRSIARQRSRRNFIQEIRVQDSEIVLEDAKAADFFQFFQNMFGEPGARSHSLGLNHLGLNTVSLEGIDHCFSEEEVWSVVRELPSDKALGPDGFTGLFFKSAWSVIKSDIKQVFNAFWSLDTRSLYLLNDAYLILLRKKPDAVEIKDFRSTSLIHSISKLLTKVLSVRLAPKLKDIVSCNQSAFIKMRCIHDNFHAVQLTCRLLHRKKIPMVLLKIDLARAFDSVIWSFLLELLEFLGFSRRWRDWIAALLATSSTKVLLNGCPGRWICHARGLRQGYPLSPMLFVVVMEALNGLIKLADLEGFLSNIRQPSVRRRALLYADDLVIFVMPSRSDLRLLKCLLEAFAGATGLCTNLSKCSATPIACSMEEIDLVVDFPCIYLGVPLHFKKLKKNEEQLIIDKVAARIPKWKGNMLNLARRAVLVKATLSAIPVHMAMATCLSSWAIEAIDKLRRSFLWLGGAVAVVGRCKVAWPTICRPIELGGLGISNLHLMGYALHVRWCWLQRTDSSRVWANLPGCDEKMVRDLFRASTEISLGDGSTVLFWVDHWLDGFSMDVLAPNLLRAVPPRFRSRTIRDGLANRTWISDIRGTLDATMVVEYVEVWERIQTVSLSEGVPDSFHWRWTTDGVYSSASAYQACFNGSMFFLGAKFLWKANVPPKVKFFAWLAAQDRCWTAERCRRRGLQDFDDCALCVQEVESINHLLMQCSYARH